MPKHQRAEQLLRPKDIDKIHLLHRTGYEHEHICERFGIDDIALRDILNRPYKPRGKEWLVKWDDESGERHERYFETFYAARRFHGMLRRVEWSKIEPA